MKLILRFFLIFVTAIFLSCSKNSKLEIIATAESLIEMHPDSALNLLNTINDASLSDIEKARVSLLSVIAKNKMDMEIANDTAIFDAIEILERKGSDIEKAKILLYAGRVLRDRNEYEKSLSFVLEAKNYFSKIDDNNLKGMIMSDLGKLNYQEDHFVTAINSYKEAFYFFSKADRYHNQIISLQMIGNSFLLSEEVNKKDSATFYYDKAINISEKFNENSAHISLLNNLGVLFIYYGEYQKANQLLEDALFYSKSKIDSFHIFLNLSEVYFSLDYLDSATYYINQSIYFLEEKESQFSPENYFSVYKLRSSIEEQKGNFETALRIKDRYVTLADSLYSELANLKLLEIQEKYQQKEIEQKYQLQKKTIFLWLFIGLTIFLILFIFIFYFNHKRRIENKNKLTEVKHRLHKLSLTHSRLIAEKEGMSKLIEELRNHNQKTQEEFTQYQLKYKKINVSILIQELFNSIGKITYFELSKSVPEIIDAIQKVAPSLKNYEICTCCLLYLGFDAQDTSYFMNLKDGVIHPRCSAIRKKLGIEPRGCIVEFLKGKIGCII
ncbi:MAG: hypothetical protein FWH18_12325 [Marinilabiliaceae bacterium]|nr:hypothetical protein [Marinilabiliaceae bacterium]